MAATSASSTPTALLKLAATLLEAEHGTIRFRGRSLSSFSEDEASDYLLRDVGFIYAHGHVLKKVGSDILIDELFHEIDKWIADGMHRPKRLKMAKPAALAMAEASLIGFE